jgi:hypothetical protein
MFSPGRPTKPLPSRSLARKVQDLTEAIVLQDKVVSVGNVPIKAFGIVEAASHDYQPPIEAVIDTGILVGALADAERSGAGRQRRREDRARLKVKERSRHALQPATPRYKSVVSSRIGRFYCCVRQSRSEHALRACGEVERRRLPLPNLLDRIILEPGNLRGAMPDVVRITGIRSRASRAQACA